MKANPYVLTFDDDADGGPSHVLWLLRGLTVEFLAGGTVVVVGEISDTSLDGDEVIVVPVDGYGSELRTLNIYSDFDEVRYC
jgi:hypothetical protein